MTKDLQKMIVRRCGRCSHGGLELRPVHAEMVKLPICFHWSHPGPMSGCGTEWAISCSSFEDTGKVGMVKRTCTVER